MGNKKLVIHTMLSLSTVYFLKKLTDRKFENDVTQSVFNYNKNKNKQLLFKCINFNYLNKLFGGIIFYSLSISVWAKTENYENL